MGLNKKVYYRINSCKKPRFLFNTDLIKLLIVKARQLKDSLCQR